MVQANRWTVDEFEADPKKFLNAAKNEGPQMVVEKDARYTMVCDDLASKPDGLQFLAKGGPDTGEA